MIFTIILFWLSFALIIYSYIGYPVLLLLISKFLRRKPTNFKAEYTPTVSLIMAAYNEVSSIESKINNCLELDYPQDKLEILIGSDGSDDGTNEIVKKYLHKGIKLSEFSPRSGKMATVNKLVKLAKNDICVFTDVTELFDKDAIHHLVKHYSDESVGAVTGNHIYNQSDNSLGSGTQLYWKLRRFLQGVESRIYSGVSCDGTIYSCIRTLFPFPPDETINDDVAVPLGILSQNKRIVFEPKAVIRGDVLSESTRFFNQKVRSQAGKYQNFKDNPLMFSPLSMRRFFIFISHNFLPVMVPWLLVTVLFTNVVLSIFVGEFFTYFLCLQVAFYLAAVTGYIAEKTKLNIPFVSIPYYFTMANIGSLFGFFAFLSKQQRVTWKKVE